MNLEGYSSSPAWLDQQSIKPYCLLPTTNQMAPFVQSPFKVTQAASSSPHLAVIIWSTCPSQTHHSNDHPLGATHLGGLSPTQELSWWKGYLSKKISFLLPQNCVFFPRNSKWQLLGLRPLIFGTPLWELQMPGHSLSHHHKHVPKCSAFIFTIGKKYLWAFTYVQGGTTQGHCCSVV